MGYIDFLCLAVAMQEMPLYVALIFKVRYGMPLSDIGEERGEIWGFFRMENKIEDSTWRSLKVPITEKKYMLKVAVKYLISI